MGKVPSTIDVWGCNEQGIYTWVYFEWGQLVAAIEGLPGITVVGGTVDIT